MPKLQHLDGALAAPVAAGRDDHAVHAAGLFVVSHCHRIERPAARVCRRRRLFAAVGAGGL